MRFLSLIVCFGVLGGVAAVAQDFEDKTVVPASQELGASLKASKAAMEIKTAEAKRARRAAAMSGFAFDSDVPVEIRTQIGRDLAMLQGVQGVSTSGLHRTVFGTFAGDSYIRFLEKRVRSVGMDDCGGNPMVPACVLFAVAAKMWLTPNYARLSRPQIYRLSILLHEARHTEKAQGNWAHAVCPKPFLDENGNEVRGIMSGLPLAGFPGCDTTPIGSYATGLIMLKSIAKSCSNCSGKLRMDAGIYADDTLKRIIDPDAKKAIVDDLYR